MSIDPSPPQLAPATRLLWRSPEVLHLELGAAAVTVEGLPAATVAGIAARRVPPPEPDDPGRRESGPGRSDRLRFTATVSGAAKGTLPAGLSGAPTRTGAATATKTAGPSASERGEIHAALSRLCEAGFLWPATDDAACGAAERCPDPEPGHDPERRPRDDPRLRPPSPRLGAQLTSLSTRHGERAARVLRARHTSAVEVGGGGRGAVLIATLLAAAGVGRVHCAVGGPTRLQHAVPGGVAPGDEGRDLVSAAEDAIRRAAPEVDTSPLIATRPDLTVVALDGPIDDDRRTALHAAGGAYLAVDLGTDGASVGPLVLPGLTSCLRCADLHRADRDPAWPALAVQLAQPQRYGPVSDITVATVISGVAVLQALAFLDGDDPATVEGTLEMALPDWRLRRRSRPAHPSCRCMGGIGAARIPP